MKKLAAIIILAFSLPVYSAANKEVIRVSLNVNVHSIRCVTPVLFGQDNKFVEITSDGVIGLTNGETELNHFSFRSSGENGCDLELLNEIAEPSRHQYGFIVADGKVTKVTEKSRLVSTGANTPDKCQKVFEETVKIDLGKGVVFSSSRLDFREANDCK